jgi:hypothetical protein
MACLLTGVMVLAVSLTSALALPRIDLSMPRDRRGLQEIAREIKQGGDENSPRVVYTYAEPSLFFQLRTVGEPIVSPIQHLPTAVTMIEGQRFGTFLLRGPHSEQDPQFQREWSESRDRWKLKESFEYYPSPLVWLDLHDPRSSNSPTKHTIQLFELSP